MNRIVSQKLLVNISINRVFRYVILTASIIPIGDRLYFTSIQASIVTSSLQDCPFTFKFLHLFY